jgi:hypothetical protein
MLVIVKFKSVKITLRIHAGMFYGYSQLHQILYRNFNKHVTKYSTNIKGNCFHRIEKGRSVNNSIFSFVT